VVDPSLAVEATAVELGGFTRVPHEAVRQVTATSASADAPRLAPLGNSADREMSIVPTIHGEGL
jgi:hypothetical protein